MPNVHLKRGGGDDDDMLNDVTNIVDLESEKRMLLASSQNIIATSEPSRIPLREEKFLNGTLLNRKLGDIAKKFKLEEVGGDVATLLSHATQEYLRNIIEKLNVITQHRLDLSVRTNDAYEVTNDVKNQLKFLEELDKMEKTRKDLVEREKLMKAAKSRSKGEDHEKMKQKAKELAQQESDEARRKDANKTALAAIGVRKKRKIDDSTSSTTITNKVFVRPKTKRVSLRDLIFFMEQEKEFRRSPLLYKALNK